MSQNNSYIDEPDDITCIMYKRGWRSISAEKN